MLFCLVLQRNSLASALSFCLRLIPQPYPFASASALSFRLRLKIQERCASGRVRLVAFVGGKNVEVHQFDAGIGDFEHTEVEAFELEAFVLFGYALGGGDDEAG